MFKINELYKPRRVSFLRLHKQDSWKLKVYSIIYGDQPFDARVHDEGLQVFVEHGVSLEAKAGLEALGHEVKYSHGGDFGGSQSVLLDPETGTFFGASDPRKDGAALGY